MKSILIYSRHSDGHRSEYNTVITAEFRRLGVEPVVVSRFGLNFFASDLYFAMIDDNIPLFILCTLASLVTRRKVSGLFFRVGECFRRTHWKYRVKYALFRILRGLPTTRLFTILPFSVDARFALVAHEGIYDPQLWDGIVLDLETSRVPSELSEAILRQAAGRRIIVALGGQNRIKGFDRFVDVWAASKDLRRHYFFVAAGKVSKDLEPHAARLSDLGGMAVDRYVSAAELHSLYHIASLVWAAYAPDYDQASGIAGRAFQYGIPTILRSGSAMTALQTTLQAPFMAMDWNKPGALTEALLSAAVPERQAAPRASTEMMRNGFLASLRSCISDIKSNA